MPRNKNKQRARRRVSQRRSAAQKQTRFTNRNAMSGAPVAVSRDLQQYTEFTGTSEGLTMKTCAAISTIRRKALTITDPTAGKAYGALINKKSTGVISPVQAGTIALSPTEPVAYIGDAALEISFTSPVFDLVGSAFTRYRLKRLRFHYEPQSPATAGERLVFAYAADPAHPILTSPDVAQEDLLTLADSIAFMPWKEWSMDVTHRVDRDKLFYTYSLPGASTATSVNLQLDRFSDFGVISCFTDLAATTPLEAGILYMETEIEFIQFCPITTLAPLAVFGLLAKLKAKREKKTEHPAHKLERLRSKRQSITSTIIGLERKLACED